MRAKAILILVLFIFAMGAAFSCAGSPADQAKDITNQIQRAAQSELESLDRDSISAAAELGKTGLAGADARKALNQLLSKHNYIADIAATDTAGKMITLAPDSYAKFEGTDVSKQDVTLEYNKTHKPMLSQVFKAVEGFNAVILIRPVISGNNQEIGSISILFKPETMLAGIAEPLVKGKEIEIIAIQLDGLNVYDTDKSQIGKNLFTDPMYQPYTDLQALGKQIVAGTTGTGSYSFPATGGGQVVKKQVYWMTVGLHDTNWRLVSSRSSTN